MNGDFPLQPVTLGRQNSQKPKTGWIPKNKWSKLALAISVVQCTIASIIEIYIAVTHRNFVSSIDTTALFTQEIRNNGTAITAYHALFIASQLFQLILMFDAIAQLSLIQLVTTTAFNWAIWAYSIIQLIQADNWIPASVVSTINVPFHPTKSAEIIQIVFMLMAGLSWVFITYKLYFVFGWTTYKVMGADVEVRSKFISYIPNFKSNLRCFVSISYLYPLAKSGCLLLPWVFVSVCRVGSEYQWRQYYGNNSFSGFSSWNDYFTFTCLLCSIFY